MTTSAQQYTLFDDSLNRHWRALQVFNGYRICLALILVLFIWFNVAGIDVHDASPELSQLLTLLYAVFNMLAFLLTFRRDLTVEWLTISQTFVDIVIFVILIHNNPILTSPLGILLNIAIAAASILLTGRLSLLFAALASLMLLAQAFVPLPEGWINATESFLAATLGVSFFVTAILGYALARRVRASEALLSQRDLDLKNMERLNARIIEHMHSGILVVDNSGRVRVSNGSACQILEFMHPGELYDVKQLPEQIVTLFQNWQKLGGPVNRKNLDNKYTVSFMSIGQPNPDAYLIFLEDNSELAKQAQEMKLVSLGRFTASIAHEMRNPLGAILHAVQLLVELPGMEASQRRLSEIIYLQAERLNQIIKNILQLTRRAQSCPETIALNNWLPHFIETLQINYHEKINVQYLVNPENLSIQFDPSQLTQVLNNLCENGLRASFEAIGERVLYINVSLDEVSHRVILEVMDKGRGILPEEVEQIFEPFYTTSREGTGLGLYIAHELCQANRARLEYVTRAKPGACFRITVL